MTILGRGDLSPRRGQRHSGRWLASLVVIAVLAAAGYFGYQHFHTSGTSKKSTAPKPCPTHEARSAASTYRSEIRQAKVTVLNASLRTGLAAQVAHKLHRDGYRVGHVGNASKLGKGVAVVRYSSDRLDEAQTIAKIVPGARMVRVSGQGHVELDIDPKFTTVGKPPVPAKPSPTPTSTCAA